MTSKAQQIRDALPSEAELIERTVRALPAKQQQYMAMLVLQGYKVECLYMSAHGRKQCWQIHNDEHTLQSGWDGLKLLLTEAWTKRLSFGWGA